MGATRINAFGGMVPITDERLLPTSAAAYSENARPLGGNLRGFRPDLLVEGLAANTQTVFRIPNSLTDPVSTTFGNSTWMEFSEQYVDVLRTPVVDDSYERYYWATTDNVPQYNTLARIQAGQSPYTLGIPAPSHAPTIVVSGGTSTTTVSRAYLTTWVSAYGEEGPAGVPSATVTAKADDNWNLTLTPPSAAESANRNLSFVRLYRTVTDSAGQASFFLVDELAIGTTNYIDAYTDDQVSANSELESTDWVAPPSLDGIVAMPNGVFAGWTGNSVYFSEPYRPHAWPVAYALTVDYPIVGLGVFGQSLVVATTGNPVIITGIDPSSMSQTKSQAFEPCLSRSSILSNPEGVYYGSPNGLVFIGPGTVQNITSKLLDKEMWMNDVDPYTLMAVRYRDSYMAFNGPRAGAGKGIFIAPDPSDFNWLSSSNNIQKACVDSWTGEILLIYDNGGSRGVYRFDPSEQTSMGDYTWKSKLFQLPKKQNLGAAKVVFDVPTGTPAQSATADNTLDQTTLASGQYALLFVYADGVHVATREIRTSGKLFRLPSGFKAEFWQFELLSKVTIHSLAVAESFRDLANV